MTTRDVLRMVRRHGMLVLLITVLGVVVGGTVFLVQPRVYESSTRMFVSTSVGSDASDLQLGRSLSQQRAEMFAELVTTPVVLEPVLDDLGHSGPSSELADDLEAQILPGSSLLQITAAADEPEYAVRLVESVSESVMELSGTLGDIEQSPQGLISITVLESPEVPDSPVRPQPLINLGVGGAAGLLLGIGSALFRHSIDNLVRDEHDAAVFEDMPIIQVPARPPGSSGVIRSEGRLDPQRAQAFHTLQSHLWLSMGAGGPYSVGIASSVAGEDSHSVVVDLAQSVAEAGYNVLVVDGDRCGGRLTQALGLHRHFGPIDGAATPRSAVIEWSERISILPGANRLTGGPRLDPLHQSAADLKAVLTPLADDYDLIVVHLPPILSAVEAAAAAQTVDKVLLVAQSGAVEKDQLHRAARRLGAAEAELLGVVLLLPARGPDRYHQPSDPFYRLGSHVQEIAA